MLNMLNISDSLSLQLARSAEEKGVPMALQLASVATLSVLIKTWMLQGRASWQQLLSCEQWVSALLPSTDTQLEYLRSSALCPRLRTSLSPSQAIDPAHLHSVGTLHSLRLPANSPFCISSFFLHPPQDIKATLSCRARTKEAATAQRNPLKCKTTEESVDGQAARRKDRKSWRREDIISVLQKPHLMPYIKTETEYLSIIYIFYIFEVWWLFL